ncbi:MAG: hypothetical protein WC787_02435 [Patescibacteria group bacterium]|jgi:hypothetical protein
MEDVIVESSMSWTPILIWIAVILVAMILAIVAIKRVLRLFTRPEMYGLSREQVIERWKMIRQTAAQGQMGAKLAVMEADTLLDSALKSMNMPGMTLGERLRMAGHKYPKLKDVWWAHKIRNQLVHEATYQLSSRVAKQALDEYEKAFKILNLL